MLIDFIRTNIKLAGYLVAAGFLSAFLFCPTCFESVSTYVKVGTLVSLLWIFLWLGNAYLSCWIDTKFSWVETPVKRLFVGVTGMIVYTLGIVLILLFGFEVVTGFDLGDRLTLTFYVSVVITIVISLFMEGRSFLGNWRQSALDAERLQKESVRAQYETLKSQVNPHFLFNSLNALTHLVYEDQDKAARFIKQLSEVYRYVLDTRDKEVVSLSDELAFLESYLFLQRIRFGEKLQVTVDLNGKGSAVAPLALQMLIENAIKHNVNSEEHPLEIRLFMEDGFIIVENGLNRKAALPERLSGLGLENIRKRYEFLSDRKVEVSKVNGKFMVRLPLLDYKE